MADNPSEAVTIGITCYNAADTIQRAIESALNQTWEKLEILVVDDCSTDKSWEIIRTLADNHNQIRELKTPQNSGPAFARQLIVNEASNDIIVFFDDDDFSSPNRILIQHQRLTAFENKTGAPHVACFASGTRIYPNGYTMDLVAIGSKGEPPQGNMIADRILLFKSDPKYFFGGGTPTCSMMARKSTIIAAGGFDTKLRRVEDADLAIKIGYLGGYFIGCPERLFTQFSTQASDKSPEKNLHAELQLAENHAAYLRKLGYYFYARKWPLLRYHHFKRNYLRMLFVLTGLFLRHPLKTAQHFLASAPRRFIHELRMR